MRRKLAEQLGLVTVTNDHVRARELAAMSRVLDALPTALDLVHDDLLDRKGEPVSVVSGVRAMPGYGGALIASAPDVLRIAARDGERLERLEAVIASVLASVEPPAVVTELVAAARTTAGGKRLTSPRTSAAERELQRASRRSLGLPPKVFLRIERAWAARRAIRAGQTLADLAFDLGYAEPAPIGGRSHVSQRERDAIVHAVAG